MIRGETGAIPFTTFDVWKGIKNNLKRNIYGLWKSRIQTYLDFEKVAVPDAIQWFRWSCRYTSYVRSCCWWPDQLIPLLLSNPLNPSRLHRSNGRHEYAPLTRWCIALLQLLVKSLLVTLTVLLYLHGLSVYSWYRITNTYLTQTNSK